MRRQVRVRVKDPLEIDGVEIACVHGFASHIL
jgi:hypothetical protein